MDYLVQPRAKEKSGRVLVVAVYLYWLILVLWQNLGSYVATSDFSVVIKAFLMLYLTGAFLHRCTIKHVGNLIVWALFSISVVCTVVVGESSTDTATIIYYSFPVLFSFLTYVCQPDAQINKKDFLMFLRLVVATVAYMALYCMIFQSSYFVLLFSRTGGYGHELSSFLISNHEYGMYLVFAITGAMICYQNSSKFGARFLYVVLILLFAINLVATFSRTSMLAAVVLVMIFLFASKKSAFKYWMIAMVLLAVLLIFTIPFLQNFVTMVLFKENNDAGRFDMWRFSIDTFQTEKLIYKVFGNGYSYVFGIILTYFEHASVHNVFLQTLLVWGILGFIFLVVLIIAGMRSAISIIKYDRNISAIFFGLALSIVAFMYTNTACLMMSPIDSYMMTVFALIIPKYVANSIRAGTYEAEELEKEQSREA